MRRISAIVLLALAPALLWAQSTARPAADQTVATAVHWESWTLSVTVTRPVPQAGINLPTAATRVRNEIEADSVEILVAELRKLTSDSLHTVDERILERQELIDAIVAAARSARTIDARSTASLRDVEVSFAVDLRTLMGALVGHERPVPLAANLTWVATTEYTGIVIYAADRLPVHGTDREAWLQPALFPGIYALTPSGDGIARLMEADHVSGEAIRRWGPVMYAHDPAEAALSERAGANPLRIIAYRAFGRYATDVVISRHDAVQILANANNRSLIAEGRVVIVLNPGQTR